MRTEFDGQIRHEPPVRGVSEWVDEWWGPGGHLVVSHLLVPSADCEEVLTTPDGEVLVNHVAKEGGDYELLPQLFGEDLWAMRQKTGHAA